jgi:hypothetical protein
MHLLMEAEMACVEGDRGVDIVDDVADAHGCHFVLLLCVELTVALVDLNDGSVRCPHLKRTTPLVIDDRALGLETGGAQSLLDCLERLVGDEVERQPLAALTVGRDRGVMKAELTSSRGQLDPVPGARAGLGLQSDRPIEAHGLGYVGDEMNRP